MDNCEKLNAIIKNKKFYPKPDTILINVTPTVHQLSKEEQIYFRNLTEPLFGFSEHMRNDMLKHLAMDYNVIIIAPYLCSFISDTISCNLVSSDLTLLIYAVRMAKALLTNPHVNLKPYIHEILPSILSCCLARKISKYHSDNHWTLRDFSANLVASICQIYSDDLNNMKARVIKIYLQGIQDMNNRLTTTYGAIKGIGSFGVKEIQTYLMPFIKNVSNKILKAVEVRPEEFSCIDFYKQQLNEAKHVRNVMVITCAPILYKISNVFDGGASYTQNYGYLGKSLYIQVKNIENIEQTREKQVQYLKKISHFLQKDQ